MDTHVKVVAVLNIAAGAFGLLLGVAALLFFGGMASIVSVSGDADAVTAVPVLGLIGSGLALIALVCSIPSIVVGIGMWRLRPWARIAGIVLSVLHLFWMIPFSTALGVYGLIVLFNKQTEALFAQPPQVVGVGHS